MMHGETQIKFSYAFLVLWTPAHVSSYRGRMHSNILTILDVLYKYDIFRYLNNPLTGRLRQPVDVN
jgi:hypothetical protein